eukprot:631346-Rhodomonas_salina.1
MDGCLAVNARVTCARRNMSCSNSHDENPWNSDRRLRFECPTDCMLSKQTHRPTTTGANGSR